VSGRAFKKAYFNSLLGGAERDMTTRKRHCSENRCGTSPQTDISVILSMDMVFLRSRLCMSMQWASIDLRNPKEHEMNQFLRQVGSWGHILVDTEKRLCGVRGDFAPFQAGHLHSLPFAINDVSCATGTGRVLRVTVRSMT